MDLNFSAEYEAFRQEVRTFIDEHSALTKERWADAEGRPSDSAKKWQRLLLQNGYACRTIPKKYGGGGAEPDVMKSFIVMNEFTKAQVSPGLAGQGISMLVPTLLENGTEEQRERWIKPTIEGDILWCQGYSEPSAGSDLANLSTKAVEVDGNFVINGQKIWTSSAHLADMMFVLVRTEPHAPKHQGISYLLCPMNAAGIEVRPLQTMTERAEFNEVFFTDVKVPKDQIVGKRGEGWKVANTTLKHERGMLGDPNQAGNMLESVATFMQNETLNNVRLIDIPVYRDQLLRLQGRAMAMKYNGLRLLTAAAAAKVQASPL